MGNQFSVSVRNAELDAIETAIGTSAILKIRSGVKPANCAAADSGDELAILELPSNWMDAAASGVKAKLGTWQVLNGEMTGDAGHYRVYASDGTTCHMQGSVTTTENGGDMTLDSISIMALKTVTITGFTLTAGNA
jgi:hypothetical protein